jgi:hypothetical protein
VRKPVVILSACVLAVVLCAAGFFFGRRSSSASSNGDVEEEIADLVTKDDDPITVAAKTRARENARRVRCASHLRQISQALLIYANDHGNVYPPSLEAFKGDPDVPGYLFACPTSKLTNYVYLPNAPAADDAIVIYEPPSNHDGDGANFLHRDGTVSWESRAAAEKLIATLSAKR